MSDASQYQNDSSIADSCQLLRRIRPEWIVPDHNTGDMRISTQGFKDPTMSIHVGDDLLSEGHSFDEVLEKYPDMDLAAITARTARAKQQAVCREHDPDELCHGIVAGKKSGSISKEFAREATANWIIRLRR